VLLLEENSTKMEASTEVPVRMRCQGREGDVIPYICMDQDALEFSVLKNLTLDEVSCGGPTGRYF
jgi:hypothetical protein